MVGVLKLLLQSWFVRRLPKSEDATLNWKAQYAFPMVRDNSTVIHYARAESGVFEIYESDEGILMLFPRSMALPAEVFNSVEGAKSRAEAVTIKSKGSFD